MATYNISRIPKENVMLIDVQYVKPDRAKKLKDALYIIWKNVSTGEKNLTVVEEPKMTIYFEKPEYRNHNFNKNHAPIEHLQPVTVKYTDIIYAIAKEGGQPYNKFLSDCFETRNFKRLQEVQLMPYAFGSDYDIRTWYRYAWKKTFPVPKTKHLTKGFLDIEVDSMEAVGFPTADLNPVDLVTLIDNDTNMSYTFCLIGVDYKEKDLSKLGPREKAKEEEKRELYKKRMEQQEYWSTHIDKLKEEAHKFFDENYPDMEYNFYFYKDEKKMLIHLWDLINQLKLDTIEIWNIGFDIPYMMDRFRALGLNPADYMVHKDFANKECFFKKDMKHFEIKNKTDFFRITGYTVFLDQELDYAAIRKGGSELRNYKLNYIAQKEIKDEKLDYADVANIKTLSYIDYLKYILYNIKDVLLQKGVENKTHDVDTCYLQSYENLTAFEDNFKQTVVLRNVQYEEFLAQGFVPGNNINQIKNAYKEDKKEIRYDEDGNEIEEDDDSSFEGALVGDPQLNDYVGEMLYGHKTNSLFRYGIDLDMSAFYPNNIIAFNIDPSCLIFKMILLATSFDVRGGKYKYNGITDVQLLKRNADSFAEDIAKEVCDNFTTQNWLSFGHKWLNLPTVTDVLEEVEKELGEL